MSFLKKLRKKIRIRKHFNFQFFRHTSILKQVKRKVSLRSTKISKKYLSRLIKEYLLREKEYSYNKNSTDIWDPIFKSFQKDLQLALHDKNKQNMSKYVIFDRNLCFLLR